MPDYSGVTWRVNYGEIAERKQFRVGRKELETFDAYFEADQLSDLITVLQGAVGLSPGVTFKGALLQAVKVAEGFTYALSIAPRLDTGTPAEDLRVPLPEVSDLVYALMLLQAAVAPDLIPSDWDVTRLLPVVYRKDDGTLGTVMGEDIVLGNLQADSVDEGTFDGALGDSEYKPVGVTDDSRFPPRVEARLDLRFDQVQDVADAASGAATAAQVAAAEALGLATTVTGVANDAQATAESAQSAASAAQSLAGGLAGTVADHTAQIAGLEAGTVGDATPTVKGKVELATADEALTGTDETRAVTPSSLKHVLDNKVPPAVPNASPTVAGRVELATDAEALTGTDTSRALTPKNLKHVLDNTVVATPSATDSVKGSVELATPTEVVAGTDATRAATPAGVKAALDALPPASVPAASTTESGTVKLATNAEAVAGASASMAVSPLNMKYLGLVALPDTYTSAADLNTFTRNGVYRIDGSPVNGPGGTSSWGYLIVMSPGNTTLVSQLWIPHHTTTSQAIPKFRTSRSGSFTPWRDLVPGASDLNMVARVKVSGTYETRVSGKVNVFVGDTNPGLLAQENDLWVNPDVTTLAAVVAAAQAVGSPLYNAIQVAAVPQELFISADELGCENTNVLQYRLMGASPNYHSGYLMPDGSISRVMGTIRIPDGWSSVRIASYWYHADTANGDVVWTGTAVSIISGATSITGGVTFNHTAVAPAANRVHRHAQSAAISVSGGRPLSIMVARHGTAAGDTFTGIVRFLGLGIERVS